MSALFDFIQTFYLDGDAVGQATSVMLTSVEVYFKGKPTVNSSINGLARPGFSYWICEVSNNQPVPSTIVKDSVNNIVYDHVNTSSDASISTVLSFRNPLILTTNKFYGIVIKYDDPAFLIWINKQGDLLLGTNKVSSGSQSRFDGKLYQTTNSSVFKEYSDRDLKFKANIAKFNQNTGNFNLVNKNYEFLTINAINGSFKGGELVYADTTAETGTVTVSSSNSTITGNGTSFTSYSEGTNIVVSNGSALDVLTVVNVTNTTSMDVSKYPLFSAANVAFKTPVIGAVYFFDYPRGTLHLVDSTAANSAFRFDANSKLVGVLSATTANVISVDRFSVDRFSPKLSVMSPPSSSYNISYELTTAANTIAASFTPMELNKDQATTTGSYILSRSQEVVEAGLFGTNKKSAVINVSFTAVASNNLFSVPYINGDGLDFYTYHNDINNTYLASRNGIASYDTEIDKNGLAKSKYISKKITFAKGTYAEDIRVFLTAFRPAGTDVRVYAKIHNASDKDAFEDKSWTPLEIKDNIDAFSSASDETDQIEYTYGFSQYPEARDTLPGTFIVQSANAVIGTSSDVSANTPAGTLVRIYNPLIVNNHEVFSVITSNSSTFTVNKQVTNVNILGSMSVDTLKYPTIVFNNIANDNVCRYYTSSQQEFDLYTSMQIKIVLLSNTSYLVPKVDKVEVIGVSA